MMGADILAVGDVAKVVDGANLLAMKIVPAVQIIVATGLVRVCVEVVT
jgi:hypothetical protein